MKTRYTLKERMNSGNYTTFDKIYGWFASYATLYIFFRWEWMEVLAYIILIILGAFWIYRQFRFNFRK